MSTCVDIDRSGLDREALMTTVQGDRELLGALIESFLGQLPGRLSDIEASVAARNGEGLMRAAHALRGSASIFSTHGVSELCRALEGCGETESWAQAEATVPELIMASGELEAALREIAGEASSADC